MPFAEKSIKYPNKSWKILSKDFAIISLIFNNKTLVKFVWRVMYLSYFFHVGISVVVMSVEVTLHLVNALCVVFASQAE